ncbi:UDP-N-acetylmuramate--L-alanine ligase [bacterium HR40]|nr:UDP-N-acetylmuramate--L-alanine ligase [bacterium HR40]
MTVRMAPLDVGTLHFVGIGGIGMSGIAEVLHALGYRVRGSDVSENANVQRLRRLGVAIAIGHDPANLADARVVVVSSAVKPDNPEVRAARERRLPVLRRAEMLGELMRFKWSVAVAGTHGKTTTTSLVAAVFDAAGLEPTVINGGIIVAYGSNARLGRGDWMVVEADESDGSFLKLPVTIAVVTNIDPEHLDHYGSFDAVRDAFRSFVERLPFYGLAVCCIDHPEVRHLISRIDDRRIVTYGLSPQADVRALNPSLGPQGERFDVVIGHGSKERRIEGLQLSLFGLHNVQNALAAVAIAHELGLPEAAIRKAFAELRGVERRFSRRGSVDGIVVIDDYGHHPVEIANVLRTARKVAESGRVIAVVQPHRYTRLASLFDDFCTCFGDADTVVVAPVYAAGEEPIPGIDHEALAAGLVRSGQREVYTIGGPVELPPLVHRLARPGDLVVCLGAGNITAWARELPAALAALRLSEVQP